MASRTVNFAAAAVALALGAAGLLTLRAQHEIALTGPQIEQRLQPLLNRELPIKGVAEDLVVSLQAHDAKVNIADGRVDIVASLQGRLVVGPSFAVAAAMRGAPRYDDGAFYFDPEEVKVALIGLSGDGGLGSALKSGLARLAGPKAAELVDKKSQELRAILTDVVDKVVKSALRQRPIYRLKDDVKGEVLRATLDQLAVENDKVVLRFTLWRVTPWAALGAAAFLCGLVALVLALLAPKANEQPR
jgi:hypothetical protein